METGIESIASISDGNAAAVQEVSAGVEEMTAQAEEVTLAAASLSDLAHTLLEGVSIFRLASDARPTPQREASDEEILAALRERIPPLPPTHTPNLGPDRRAGLARRIEQGVEPKN
jgi:hypothetical protein